MTKVQVSVQQTTIPTYKPDAPTALPTAQLTADTFPLCGALYSPYTFFIASKISLRL